MSKNPKKTNKIRDGLLLLFVLTVALIPRLYRLNTPLADFHSWRQADTAAVARTFTRDGFNLLLPKYDDLSNVQSGFENPEGYRMVEFPLYNAAFAGLYVLFRQLPLEVWGRIVSIISSLIVTASIYFLVKKEIDRGAALIASLIFAVLPFSVFFSRVVLPEMTALAFVFTGLVLLHRFEETNNRFISWIWLIAAGLMLAAGILTKPTVIFFGVSYVYLFFRKYDIQAFKKFQPYLFAIISLLPLYLWRQYILKYPEGIPYSEWLFTRVNTYMGMQDIFFRPAFFRWIFFERINNLILGGFLSVFFILGILVRQKKYFLHSILLSSFLYVFTFQGGNVQHEYYQVLILPALAIFTGIGIHFFYAKNRSFLSPLLTIPLIVGLIVFSLFMSLYRVKDYFNYSTDLATISTVIKSISKPGDKIVTDRMGDTTLLYLSDRRGAPHLYKDLPVLAEMGYSYFVTQNKEVAEKTKADYNYPVIFENDKVFIFSLL